MARTRTRFEAESGTARLARSGIRTLGTFGTRRPFPSRTCIAARGSAGIGRFDHHPRFRRQQDYRQAQPREAQPAVSLIALSQPSDRANPCERPEQALRAPERRRIAPRMLCAVFPAYYGKVDRVNRLVVASSIIDRPIRPPVDTYTTRLGVAAECSREHRGQGTDRCKSRLASGSAKIARVRPLEIPRGVHRVLSPHVAVQSHRFCFQGIGTARVDTRAARKPWGVGSADTRPTLPTTSSSPMVAVTREKVVHRHTCRNPRRKDVARGA